MRPTTTHAPEPTMTTPDPAREPARIEEGDACHVPGCTGALWPIDPEPWECNCTGDNAPCPRCSTGVFRCRECDDEVTRG